MDLVSCHFTACCTKYVLFPDTIEPIKHGLIEYWFAGIPVMWVAAYAFKPNVFPYLRRFIFRVKFFRLRWVGLRFSTDTLKYPHFYYNHFSAYEDFCETDAMFYRCENFIVMNDIIASHIVVECFYKRYCWDKKVVDVERWFAGFVECNFGVPFVFVDNASFKDFLKTGSSSLVSLSAGVL